MKSRFAKGCLAAILVLVALGGYGYYRFKTPPQVGENFKTLSPEEQKARRKDARKLEDNFQDVARKIKSGDKSPFKLAASEAQLNTLLQDRINTDKFPIHDLRVGLDDGKLTLQGIVPYNGSDVPATLEGTVSAKNGKLDYDADSLLLGGFIQAPKKWKRKAESEITPRLNKLLQSNNVTITRATVENKQLVIEGTPR